jgi:hypothetical protein
LSLGAVAVVGAGLSIASRFPLTKGLTSLLWEALDSDPAARSAVASKVGRTDAPAKLLVGDDWDAVQVAWAEVATSPDARRRFQTQFVALDTERSQRPSPAHEGLTRLIHAGVVECVVSLNWDTALERAYRRLYGTSLPEGVLFKPHGDAASPNSPWTLPHEPGLVPVAVAGQVTQLASEHARTLLVIGYSESDRIVVDELIRPLDTSWRTIRVGPSANGANDLPVGAEVAMPMLAKPYAEREERASWHVVSYTGRRGLDAALAGERLGPQDVDACPELDEVAVVVQALRRDKSVVLNGQSGVGKSITAYQALHRLADEGFETLRLRDDARSRGLHAWLTDLAAFPQKKVLLVDDAQDLSPDRVRELAEAARADTLVLVVGIDHVAGGVRTVQLSASAAVARLARFVREGRSEVFPLVRALDDQVGGHARDFFFDQRIEAAEQQSTSWQFFYMLTGGWRRVRRAALELRDDSRADLALLAIAVAQTAGVDAGVQRRELLSMLNVLGRDEAWLDTALSTLRARRLVTDSDGRIRCTHLRAALHVIEWMLHPPMWNHTSEPPIVIPPISSAANPALARPPRSPAEAKIVPPSLPRSELEADRDTACALIELVLESSDTPLRGCSWFVGSALSNDSRWMLIHRGVLSRERLENLAGRALSTPAGGDVASAANLVADLVGWFHGSVLESIKANAARLSDWYQSISAENGWALGDLANNVYNQDKEFAAQIAGYADPARLANLILDGGWPHIYSTSHALDRICTVGGTAAREAVATHLDEDAYQHMLSTGDPDLSQTATLIQHIASADHDLSLRLFQQAAPTLAGQFASNPARQWNGLSTPVMDVLGYGPHFLRRHKHPPAKCRRAARTFIRALDRQRIAEVLAGPNLEWGQMNFHEFVDLLIEADPTTFKDIATRVDLVAFEQSLRSRPKDSPRTALYVCACLAEHRPDEIHEILDRLEPDLSTLDPLIAYMAPRVAIRALRRGLPLDLGLAHHHWDWAAVVLMQLYEHDPHIAMEVAEANRVGMSKALRDNTSDPFEGLREWVSACDKAVPELVDSVIRGLPEGAVSSWARALRRPKKHGHSRRQEIAPLVHRATHLSGHAQKEAQALLKQFPSLEREGPQMKAIG